MPGQLIQRGDSWLIRIFLGRDETGKRRYFNKTVKGSKKAAERELTKILRDRDTGALVEPTRQTLAKYLLSWLATSVRPRLRARTAADYSDVVRLYIEPELGHRRLSALMPAEIRRLYVRMRERGLSARSVRKTHSVLHAALEQAVRDRLLAHNPAHLAVDALPRHERREMKALTAAHAQELVGALECHPRGAFWMLLMTTGLRPAEALALRWTDLEGDRLHVRRTLVDRNGQPRFEEPKTKKSRRCVPLSPSTSRALQSHRTKQVETRLAAGPTWQDNDLVFTTSRGRPLRQSNLTREFKRILKAAELPNVRVYDLRHTFASLLGAGGVPLKVVSELLGHSTITLTADVYSHVFDSQRQLASEKIESMVFGT